ncbi:MAG TPA: hypothetical protein VLM89_08050 [Phycisphaerae bacterium]|nr:hypothetical protein [Phycisphaerae bacterium]
MTIYRLRLALRSPLGTPLAADTLFGHLCWGIVYHEGAEHLTRFLADMEQPSPPLVISDPLPAGYWPMPALPEPPPRTLDGLINSTGAGSPLEAHDQVRSVLKRRFIPHASWPGLAERLDMGSVARVLLHSRTADPVPVKAFTLPHNTVNRLTSHTSTATEEGGTSGGLFFDEYLFPNGSGGRVDYDVWAASSYPAERVHRIFAQGLAGGYGKDAGTGKGFLTVEGIDETSLPAVGEPNGVITLGTCVPSREDPTHGAWLIEVRHGRLGGAWTSLDESAVFKRPVMMLARGAVFRTSSPRPVMGRMVHDVHPVRSEVVTCGYTLTLPVHLTEEAVPCQPIG